MGAIIERIYVPGAGFKHRPYVDVEQIKRGDHIPVMNGTYVFRNAANCMANVTKEILERNNLKLEDISMVLMHQANKRINERVQKMLDIPEEKIIHNIHKYGNTTAATIPLLWDESRAYGPDSRGRSGAYGCFWSGNELGGAALAGYSPDCIGEGAPCELI